ncbi:hypothetical protein DIPPA_21502 [Diplonema papillatum]|nr:hypothetical protein DIPPA_21502 [Diplonema papillatum]
MRTIAAAALVAFAAASVLDEREHKMRFTFHADGQTSGDNGGVDLSTAKTYHRHEDTFSAMHSSSDAKVEYKGNTATNTRAAKPLATSRCVDYKGETDALCAQTINYPTCPMTFEAAWYRCLMLGSYLYHLERVETTAALTWYTSADCTVYRTFCEVNHETHLDQYEDETYDYTNVCDGTVSIQYSYSNQLNFGANKSSAISVGNFRLPLGQQESVYAFYNGGKLIREELLTVAAFERDVDGYVVLSTGGVDLHRSRRRSPEGLWSQFDFVVNTFETDVKTSEVLSPFHYHISPLPALSTCPKDGHKWHRHSRKHHGGGVHTGLIVSAIAAVVVLAIVSVGAHWYIVKRRAWFTARALQAQQIQVVSATVVDPSELSRCGSIVQGVPVDISSGEKCAGPLPPATASSTPDLA